MTKAAKYKVTYQSSDAVRVHRSRRTPRLPVQLRQRRQLDVRPRRRLDASAAPARDRRRPCTRSARGRRLDQAVAAPPALGSSSERLFVTEASAEDPGPGRADQDDEEVDRRARRGLRDDRRRHPRRPGTRAIKGSASRLHRRGTPGVMLPTTPRPTTATGTSPTRSRRPQFGTPTETPTSRRRRPPTTSTTSRRCRRLSTRPPRGTARAAARAAPAAARSPARNTARSSPGRRFPLPTSTSVPTIERTICQQNAPDRIS